MDLNKHIKETINFSFIDSLKNKNIQKYFAIITLLYLLFFVIYFFITNQLMSNIFSGEIIAENIFQKLFEFTAYLLIISIPLTIALTFMEYQIIKETLKIKKMKCKDLTLNRFIKFLFLPLISFIYAILSIFNIKFLAIGISALLLFFIGSIAIFSNILIGTIILLISTLLGLIYFCIVIWGMIRLSLLNVIFVEGCGITEGLRTSWKKTKDNVLNILVIWVVFFVIIYVISLIVTSPSLAYSLFYSSINAESTAIESSLVFDPIYNLLLLPSIIVSGYILIVQNCVLVSIYSILKKNK